MCWRLQPYVLEHATLCVLQVKRREMLEHHAFDREAPRPFKQECDPLTLALTLTLALQAGV